jgi:hypothetical protein
LKSDTAHSYQPRRWPGRGQVRRWLNTGLLASLLLLVASAGADRASAATLTNPLTLNGRPFSCPDPDVFRLPHAREWVAACTSDYGQDNPAGLREAALPLYSSHDLKHWRFRSFIFPPGRHPSLAEAPIGHWPGGRYWAPEIHYIDGRWVAYFGAALDPPIFRVAYHHSVEPGTFGLFVAWTSSLFGGRWQSRLLHYPGQYNAVRGNGHELSGGVIDPSEAQDPRTGQRYLVWAKQSNQIWIGELSEDGLHLLPKPVRFIISPHYAWQCAPSGRSCVVEGPVLYWDSRQQVFELFYNADSTWQDSYKIGVAISTAPLLARSWVPDPRPILQSSDRLHGPGIGAQPFVGPDGQLFLACHVQLHPSHASQARYLAILALSYDPQQTLKVPVFPINSLENGRPTTTTSYERVELPRVSLTRRVKL